jgi:hypothetical protein
MGLGWGGANEATGAAIAEPGNFLIDTPDPCILCMGHKQIHLHTAVFGRSYRMHGHQTSLSERGVWPAILHTLLCATAAVIRVYKSLLQSLK